MPQYDVEVSGVFVNSYVVQAKNKKEAEEIARNVALGDGCDHVEDAHVYRLAKEDECEFAISSDDI